MSYNQPISGVNLRYQTTMMAWIQVYSAVVQARGKDIADDPNDEVHEQALALADAAIAELEKRFPQSMGLNYRSAR